MIIPPQSKAENIQSPLLYDYTSTLKKKSDIILLRK
ncbi:MAG: hypothetical protein ACI8RD_000007 [Bacillariaceae sp.]|jgi:hypothetical protein